MSPATMKEPFKNALLLESWEHPLSDFLEWLSSTSGSMRDWRGSATALFKDMCNKYPEMID